MARFLVLVLVLVLILAMAAHSSATWCICKEGLSDQALQKTLDYACGAGADCNPTHQNGPCFNPNTVRAHCNYAVNSYFQKKGQTPTACDFSGTAYTVTSDPSSSGCSYPASASGATRPVSTTTNTPSTSLPSGGSPVVTTPSTGILGGSSNGLGPSGMNTDMSDAGILLPKNILLPSIILVFSVLVYWWA
ncbi:PLASMODESMATA CALLOSE-BINDING PROTEIN 3-like [Olea europaea var. sylvestris]|uniref:PLASMODESMATA CALLOSE-BINDING PROTEIN 3-like n=1 Tax=Olea europaea subsp. europaea TaxID=158383 RepID=A0A8S0TEC7_OLEEU|nr:PLASMODESMATA CALLOSE-BINDING PROTEIN 3-like [Olea europaea var. sylvestris]CAA3003493.1 PLASMODESMATA CALLOSE-BINDING PROTEIN 3-like [Olea europaea subsp. europaea]